MRREPGDQVERRRANRALAELRGKRFIDQSKDTQFTDAWILLAIVLTSPGLSRGTGFCWRARGRSSSHR